LCPENFAARYLLAKAEAASAAENASGFQAAIAAAQQSGATGVEALAHELASRRFREHGEASKAETHWLEAISAYERWGAHAKAHQLRGRE
jgi:hypothetical protein